MPSGTAGSPRRTNDETVAVSAGRRSDRPVQAWRHRLGRLPDDGRNDGAADPAEARQDPLVLEPGSFGGMVQQDGLAGGGPNGTRTRDGMANERIHQS